jgi:pyridoxal phosphate enzyme (YggS family)
MTIGQRLNAIRSEMPPHCRLIAVSKTHPVETILKAYETGHRIFGENKVQEMGPKAEALPKDIEWHMIGTLQRNKVKYIAPFVGMIHSVDGAELLTEINKQAQKANRIIPCLLQIHIAKEETKFGFSPDEVLTFLSSGACEELKNVRITGLMGMATFTENTSQIREEFKSLRSLFDKIKDRAFPQVEMKELSMGMSSDYKIAMEEGSTLVRIGTSIFGSRNIQDS